MSKQKMIMIGAAVYSSSIGLACLMYFADGDANDARLDGLGRMWNFGWLSLSVLTLFVMTKIDGRLASMNRKETDTRNPDQYGEVKNCIGFVAFFTEWGLSCSTNPNTSISSAFRTASGEVVKMSSEGAEGRFNRAQRGVNNWMEGPICLTLAELSIIAIGIGSSAFALALLIGISRVGFTYGYSLETPKRIPGFLASGLFETTAHIILIIFVFKAGFKSGFDLGN